MRNISLNLFYREYGKNKAEHSFFIIRMLCSIALLAFMLLVWPANKISFSLNQETTASFENWSGMYLVEIKGINHITQPFTASSDKLNEISFFVSGLPEDTSTTIMAVLAKPDGTVLRETSLAMTGTDSNTFVTLPMNIRLQKGSDYHLILASATCDFFCNFTLFPTSLCSYSVKDWAAANENSVYNLALNFNYSDSADFRETVYSWLIALFLLAFLLLLRTFLSKRTILYSFLFLYSELFIFAYFYIEKIRPFNDHDNIIRNLFAVIAFLVLLLTCIQLFLLLSRTHRKPERFFAVAAVLWGIAYSLILLPFSTPDELKHFSQANKVANQLSFMTPTDEEGMVYLRAQDNLPNRNLPNYSWITTYYSGITSRPTPDSLTYVTGEYPDSSGVDGAPFQAYLPSSLAILLGRAFRLNYVWLISLGRLFNLAAYTLIMYYAIKLIPFGKWSLYIMAQFPMLLQISSAYTYDTLNIALIALSISYLLHLLYVKETVRFRDFLLFGVFCALWSAIKVVYIPIILLIFLIPARKIIHRPGHKHLAAGFKLFSLALGMLPIIISRIGYVLSSLFQKTEAGDPISITATIEEVMKTQTEYSLYNIGSFINDKLKIITLAANTFFDHFDTYFNQMIGSALGWQEIHVPAYLIEGFLLLLVFSLMSNGKFRSSITGMQRFSFFITGFLCICAVGAALLFAFTPVNYDFILGIQGRYFIAVIPLLIPLCINGVLELKKEPPVHLWVLGGSFLNLLTICYVFQTVISR